MVCLIRKNGKEIRLVTSIRETIERVYKERMGKKSD
jgi:hypothetical protein